MTTHTSRASKRWMMVATAAIAVGSTLAVSGAASAGPGITAPVPARVSGPNRWGTAAEISKSLNPVPTQASTVVVANGVNFPDGLAAARFSNPILLTERDSLPAETLAELQRLDDAGTGIADITVVGGTSAVSSAVFEQLGALAPTSRVAGANRYETAIAIAVASGGGTTAILATGEDYPDALAAGVLSQATSAPILLNNGSELRSDVLEYLLAKNVTMVTIVGGEAVVPASVATQLTDYGIDVTRLSGSDRAGTAVAIAEELWGSSPSFRAGVTAVNGSKFADALTAGPLAYADRAPILVVAQNSIPAATAAYHVENCHTIAKIRAIGGTAVISDVVVAGAVGAATCAAPAISSATLVNNDFNQAVFTVDDIKVTAKAGSAADGAAANVWQIALIQSGDPGTENVVADATGAAFGGVPTFVVTANLPLLTNAGFVSIWNTGVGSLATATTAVPSGVTGLTGGTAASPRLLPSATILTSAGSQDSVVTTTFDRPVTAAVPTGLYPNLNPGTVAILGAPTTTSVIPAAGTTTVTYTWNDVSSVIPSLPNYQVRFAAGGITAAGSGVSNVAVAAKTLTAP